MGIEIPNQIDFSPEKDLRARTHTVFGGHHTEIQKIGTPVWFTDVYEEVKSIRPDTLIVDGIHNNFFHIPGSMEEIVPIEDLQRATSADTLRILAADIMPNLQDNIALENELSRILKEQNLFYPYAEEKVLQDSMTRQIRNAKNIDMLTKTGLGIGISLALIKLTQKDHSEQVTEELPSQQPNKITRRRFVKNAGLVIGGALLGAATSSTPGRLTAGAIRTIAHGPQIKALGDAIDNITDPLFLEVPHLDIRNTLYGLVNNDDFQKNPESVSRCIVMGGGHRYGEDPVNDLDNLQKTFIRYVSTVVYNLKVFAKMNPLLQISDADIEERIAEIFAHYDIISINQTSETNTLPTIHNSRSVLVEEGTYKIFSTENEAELGSITKQENTIIRELIAEICKKDALTLCKTALQA